MTSLLITAGIILVTLGLIAHFAETRAGTDASAKTPAFSLLPGDIKYENESGTFKFYFPVTTSIVLSIVLSLVMWLLS